MGNRFHIFRKNDDLNMQTDYIFFDTETKSKKENENEILSLKLGWALYWNRETDKKDWCYFKKKGVFWDFVVKKLEEQGHIIMFAHNIDFDIKIVDGFNELFTRRNFILKSFYIKGNVFILNVMDKNFNRLEIWDTMNYVPRSLKYIGHFLKKEKQEIDFKHCSVKQLKEYCKNDVEITHLFIKSLIDFLSEYELTKLQPTAASLAFNCFRHKFYDEEKNPIKIHAYNPAIYLERNSYRGGISDCFKVGYFKEKLYKIDINSMYPYIMKKFDSPVSLMYYGSIENEKSENLLHELKYRIKEYHAIANCRIYLPEEYAYILTRGKIEGEIKCLFIYGEFEGRFTTPELEFILKHGKILEVKELALYEKSNIFSAYVDFFFNKRKFFIKNGDKIKAEFCKLQLNCLYGKWGQQKIEYKQIGECETTDFKSYNILDEEEEYTIMHFGKKLIKMLRKKENSYDSFVAIPSLITSYARMYLIETLLKAGRENVYYVDTDSLIINEVGLNKLKDLCTDNYTLGKFKLEEISHSTEIFRPKFYKFNNELKCKGVKKDSIKIIDDEEELVVEQKQFERFRTALKNDTLDKQVIKSVIKHMKKRYNKGEQKKNNDIRPYEAKKVKPISI